MSQKSTYGDNVISLRDVKIVQKNFTVLSNVNLTIKKGKFNYLIGKTGSGKSSLLKVLYGHLPLREGEGEIGEQFVSAVVGKGGMLHRNHDQSPCFSRVRFSRKAKNGAPRSAVRMPIGSSAARRLRAQISTSARKIAPMKHAAGRSRA